MDPWDLDLHQLVRAVERQCRRGSSLDRLVSAVAMSSRLNGLTDELVNHFVEEARRDGCSWAQIGERLGVTKQAAQQRHTLPRGFLSRRRARGATMSSSTWQHLTDRAERVVAHAQEEAGRLGHNYIGTEHLLLGVLREQGSRGADVLASNGVSLSAARKQLEVIVGRGSAAPGGPIPFTPRTKKVLEIAVRHARAMGQDRADTEHLILGILTEGEGVAVTILRDLKADLKEIGSQLSQRPPKP